MDVVGHASDLEQAGVLVVDNPFDISMNGALDVGGYEGFTGFRAEDHVDEEKAERLWHTPNNVEVSRFTRFPRVSPSQGSRVYRARPGAYAPGYYGSAPTGLKRFPPLRGSRGSRPYGAQEVPAPTGHGVPAPAGLRDPGVYGPLGRATVT